ncbi:MAG: FeS-binding protein [Actinobacteria bacterium]|nr:FeS-binding protein [Actinomycetota bacterium]
MAIRATVGIAITLVLLAFALKRGWFLYSLAKSGQPAVGRTTDAPKRIEAEATEVFGQKKLLKWTIPGLAHFFAFWGFVILGITVVEAFGELVIEYFAFPIIGNWAVIRFMEDLFAVLVFIGIVMFAIIRIVNNPAKQGRASRFFGSHTTGAWLVLVMIFLVVFTLLTYRGAKVNMIAGNPDHEWKMDGAFASQWFGVVLEPLGKDANLWIETVFVWAHVSVILVFLLIVLHSKHLHIFSSPINVYTSRRPNALGPLLPIYYKGEPVNFEDPPEDARFGKGQIQDFTWKNYLDFMACTECGRCQSQCPAWNTEKPLSPKLLILDLRDQMYGTAPYLMKTAGNDLPQGDIDEKTLEQLPASVQELVQTPFIGSREGTERAADDGYTFDGHRSMGPELPIIADDVLWSCTTCGACVNQCPVDIEHIDHIVDMRRHQVMVATEFPSELNGLFKNVESKGNPWGMNASARNAWIEEVDFPVRVFGMEGEEQIPVDVEYLFWVGCAGALEDRAKRTTKAVAELLHTAGVNFMVLGENETCTGDPARRAGNEFLFQMQAMQNVEMLNEIKATRIVVTCPHCLNTLGREYPQNGGHYEVVHHTQLLNQLVSEGRLTPVKEASGSVTYHDPCYLGRHNNVYAPPRELINVSTTTRVEMPRHGEKSFCCGAGGARMWMEEKLGTKVNVNRADEAIATGAGTIAVACPFCSVMLHDAVTARQQAGQAPGVEVKDVATLLLEATRPGS